MTYTTSDIQKTTELKPCFCGRIPKIETRDVEPQEDRFPRGKTITFVLCECGQCLFDGALHEGFADEGDAATAWNYRVAPEDSGDPKELNSYEAMRGALEKALDLLEGYTVCSDGCTCGDGWGHVERHEIEPIRAALAKYRGEA